MTDVKDIIKLADYEAEDIGDIIAKLEKSFQIRLEQNDFEDVDDFGKLCDVIIAKINYESQEDCTKQQAFYKIRQAISSTKSVDIIQIKLDTKLAELFPIKNRRRQVKEFQKQLGIKIKFLTYSGWIGLALLIGLISSFIAFFFDWKIAVAGIILSAFAYRLADIFGKDLEIETLKQLTEKAVREYYIDVRRSKFTMNKNEILGIIRDNFSNDLHIDEKNLTREAAFSWKKNNYSKNLFY